MANLDMKSVATAFLNVSMPADEKAVYASLFFDAMLCEAEIQINLRKVGKVISALSIQDLAVALTLQDLSITRAINNLVLRQWVTREGLYYQIGDIKEGVLIVYSQKFATPVKRAERADKPTPIGEKIRAAMAASLLARRVEAIKKTDAGIRQRTLNELTRKPASTPSGRLLDYFKECHLKKFGQPYVGQLTASGAYSPAKEMSMQSRLLSFCGANEATAKGLILWLVNNWELFQEKTKWAGPCNISVLATVRGYNSVKDIMRGATSIANRYSEGGPDVGFA